MIEINARDSKISKLVKRFPTLWVGLTLVVVILLISIRKGELGDIGSDSDDILRLVQLRDFLGLTTGEGQNWFDTTQYRLGLDGGTNMHWSRIPDIPLILLTAVFDVFMDKETALQWAFTVWPPLSSLILVFAMAKGARYWSVLAHSETRDGDFSNDRTYTFTLVLIAFFVFYFYRFHPGAIDHHNIQIGLIALAMAYALDPRSRFFTFALSGFSTALSVAIGVEVYIFAAIICAFMALNWFVRGSVVALGTQGFGIGLAGGLTLAFFGTIAPANYGVVACDALSLITLCAGFIGGVGLTVAARFAPQQGFKRRFFALSGVALACVVVLSFLAPECLANPLNALPDDVERLWLNQISEAQPISLSMKDAVINIPFMLGAPFLGLLILCWHFWTLRRWSGQVLVLMLLLGALALTFYQQRFYPFAYVMAFLPLAGFISRAYIWGRARIEAHEEDGKKRSNIAYIGALTLSIPFMWAMPGYVLTKDDVETSVSANTGDCYSDAVMSGLTTLPNGLIASPSNGGSHILEMTKHRALSGNYHRNIGGISAQINIATSHPDVALDLLRHNGVNYVLFCYPSVEVEMLINENAEGLYGNLKAGSVPRGLVPALSFDEGDKTVSIYHVTG